MRPRHWHAVALVAVLTAAAFLVSTALIVAFMRDPVWVGLAIQRGDAAAIAQALVNVLASAARALLRWL